MTQYCCEKMEHRMSKEYTFIEYMPESREYVFNLHGNHEGAHFDMQYCPWCGKKLPESLGEEWCKVIKEDLGVEDVDAEEWAKLPEKYKTEQWWRERGL
jgi:hypothetical protein